MPLSLVVQNIFPAMYRLSAHYKALNTTALKNTWPISHRNVLLQEMRGGQAFPLIDSTLG